MLMVGSARAHIPRIERKYCLISKNKQIHKQTDTFIATPKLIFSVTMPTLNYFKKQFWENTRADWLRILFLYLELDTELARAVDAMMARAKRIYILIIKVNKLFPFFSSRCFLKDIETCTPCFYRVIETLVKVWENSSCGTARVSTAFFVFPNLHSSRVSKLDGNTVHVFYFLYNTIMA